MTEERLALAELLEKAVYILWRETVHRRRPAVPASQRG